MSDVSLYTGEEKAGIFVSNTFIDNYMKQANGEYVKIYLYLLRSLGMADKDFSIEGMADALEHTEKDISRALHYWEKENLLRLEYNEAGDLKGICLLDPEQPRLKVQKESAPVVAAAVSQKVPMRASVSDDPVSMPMAGEPIQMQITAPMPETLSMPTPMPAPMIGPAPTKIVPMQPRRGIAKGPDHNYTAGEITLLGKEDEVQEILFVTESYMGHPLSPTESTTVLYWYDGMGMSCDLIEYLVEYCIERGHKDMRYMNTVAINWSEEGIDSKEKALHAVRAHSSLYHSVINAFGISGRNLSVTERQFVDKWQSEYGFSGDIIEEACSRTILKAHNPSFSYADTILRSWHDAGVRSFSDVAAVDDAYSKRTKSKQRSHSNAKQDRFHNFTGHDYDFDSIESRLLKQE